MLETIIVIIIVVIISVLLGRSLYRTMSGKSGESVLDVPARES